MEIYNNNIKLEIKKPIVIGIVQNKKHVTTVLENMNFPRDELQQHLSNFKRMFGCGGHITENIIILQGNFKYNVKEYLEKLGEMVILKF